MVRQVGVWLLVASVSGGCGGGGASGGGEPGDAATPFDLATAASLDLASADPVTPDSVPDGSAAIDPGDLAMKSAPVVGGMARVTAGSLNLRTGPGTMNMILTAMPCGAEVGVVGGPTNGWWNVVYQGQTGWSSGNYLVAAAAFDPAVCMHVSPDGGGGVDGGADGGAMVDPLGIFARARQAVGYSYWWGHGAWRADQAQIGSCMGSCPNCSHGGNYGADCSGFVAKCWQIPGPSAVTTDLHPYSTFNFYNDTTHWSKVPRAQLQPADALVYNANGAGHVVLVESAADPWGSSWLYEARGCATGVVHDLRTVPNNYIAIRREGL